MKALESKIFKGRKEDKGCQGLTEPGEPSSSISVSPCQSLPLSAIVSRSQLLSALFAFLALPAIDNLWHPMPAFVNLCQSLSPPGGEGGGALLDKALYHAIGNTANQNTEKLLYIRRYYTQSSHRALRSYSC